jgi:hypothetical protein
LNAGDDALSAPPQPFSYRPADKRASLTCNSEPAFAVQRLNFSCFSCAKRCPQEVARRAGTQLLAVLMANGSWVKRQGDAIPEEVLYRFEKALKSLRRLPDEKSVKQACRLTVDTFIQSFEMQTSPTSLSLSALKIVLLKYIDLQQTAPGVLAEPFYRGLVKRERFRHKPMENLWNAVLRPRPVAPFTTKLLPQFLTEVERHIDRRVIGEPLLQLGPRLLCREDARADTRQGGGVAADFHDFSDGLASYLPGNQDWTPYLVRGCSTLSDDELKSLAYAFTRCCADPDLKKLFRPRYPSHQEETQDKHWLVVSQQQGTRNEHLPATLQQEAEKDKHGLVVSQPQAVKNERFFAALQQQGARDERLLVVLLEALRLCVLERLHNAPRGEGQVLSVVDEEDLRKANIEALAQVSASMRVNYLGLMDDVRLAGLAQYLLKEEELQRQNALSLNSIDSVSSANRALVQDALNVVQKWRAYQHGQWWGQASVHGAAEVIVRTNSLHSACQISPESIALLHTELLVFPEDPSSWQDIKLTRAHGATFCVQVGPQFHRDTIERSLVSLSVRGISADGSLIQHTALVPGLSNEQREPIVADMLVALDSATAGHAGLLTLITTQQIVGAMSDGLLKLGASSPIRLTSDMAAMPGTLGGRVHFDVVCPPYGPVILHTTIQFKSVNNYVKVSAQPFVGGSWNRCTGYYEQCFELDPEHSHYNIRTAFYVWPQERRMAMAAPLEFDYAFCEQRALD